MVLSATYTPYAPYIPYIPFDLYTLCPSMLYASPTFPQHLLMSATPVRPLLQHVCKLHSIPVQYQYTLLCSACRTMTCHTTPIPQHLCVHLQFPHIPPAPPLSCPWPLHCVCLNLP